MGRGVQRTPEEVGGSCGGARAGLETRNNASFSEGKQVRRGAMSAAASQ
ncbi:MAG: hypothetical protein OJF49_001638 [Ktedonobacterales bacterium]|nr:MAG: hypothetical protein OJF49_001638 [Ktedonobacterales bacterium]